MRDNLSFAVGGIGNVHLQDVDVVRCFNVLLYFDDKFREQALDWFQGVLREGGLLFCGANSALSTGFRYFVYQKRGGRLLGREFAFSIDNVWQRGSRQIGEWKTRQDNVAAREGQGHHAGSPSSRE